MSITKFRGRKENIFEESVDLRQRVNEDIQEGTRT